MNNIKCPDKPCPRFGLENVCYTNLILFCNIRNGKAVSYTQQYNCISGTPELTPSVDGSVEAGEELHLPKSISPPAYNPIGVRMVEFERRQSENEDYNKY